MAVLLAVCAALSRGESGTCVYPVYPTWKVSDWSTATHTFVVTPGGGASFGGTCSTISISIHVDGTLSDTLAVAGCTVTDGTLHVEATQKDAEDQNKNWVVKYDESATGGELEVGGSCAEDFTAVANQDTGNPNEPSEGAYIAIGVTGGIVLLAGIGTALVKMRRGGGSYAANNEGMQSLF